MALSKVDLENILGLLSRVPVNGIKEAAAYVAVYSKVQNEIKEFEVAEKLIENSKE